MREPYRTAGRLHREVVQKWPAYVLVLERLP